MLGRGPVRVVRRHEFCPESNCKIHAASVLSATALGRAYRLEPVLLYLIRILSSLVSWALLIVYGVYLG
jgi:hypothetical protein